MYNEGNSTFPPGVYPQVSNPNLCYPYMSQAISQVQPPNQYMQMLTNYSNVSPAIGSSSYPLLSHQPNFFFVNSSSVGGSVPNMVNQQRDLSNPYVHLSMNNPAVPFVSSHLPSSTK